MSRERFRPTSASGDQAPQISSSPDGGETGSSQGRPVFFRANDLAKRYGVHPITIYKWVRARNLPPPTRLSRGVTAWRSDHIEAWEFGHWLAGPGRTARHAAADH